MVFAIIVLRHIGWVGPVGKAGPHVHDVGRRRVSLSERCHIGEWLERGARLSRRGSDVHLAVDLWIEIVDAPQHGVYLAPVRIHHDDSRIAHIILIAQTIDVFACDALDLVLQFEVQRRIDAQALLVDRREAVLFLEELSDVHHKVGSLDLEWLGDDVDLLLLGLPCLLGGYVAQQVELVQDGCLASLGRIKVIYWIQERILGHGDKHCALGKRQVLGALAKVLLRSGLNAIGNAAIVHRVQIPLQDLVLALDARIAARQLDRQDGFFDLAGVGDVVLFLGKQHELDQLLSQRAAALDRVALYVAPQSTKKALNVDTWVVVKVLVLHGDGAIADVLRDTAQG